jgi:hypothetical protein
MTHHLFVWIAYILAAVLTLASKLYIYASIGINLGKSLRTCLKEWFLDPTLENASSWVGTIGVVWTLGYIYIERVVDVAGYLGPVFQSLPVAVPIAVVLGWAAEMVAPDLLKKVVSMFTKKG